MRALTIVNPAAGAGSTRKKWPRLRDELLVRGIESQFRFTTERGEGTALAREAVQSGFDTVIAVGGDGTVNEVANGILATALNPVRLGVIPTGTGHDFARSLGISDWRDGIDRLALGDERRVDVGLARWSENGEPRSRYFVLECSTGFVTNVNRGLSPRWKKLGRTLPYAARTLVQLRHPVSKPATWTIDGIEAAGQLAAIVVFNGEYFGGGMRGAPGASLEDGLLDVVVGRDAGRWQILRILQSIYSGSHLRLAGVSLQRAKSVRVEGRDIWFDLDGEVIGLTPLDVTVLPGALTLAQ